MSSITLFILFVSVIALLFLVLNLIFAPHNPYQEKYSIFECGFHSFLGQNRTQFGVKFFIFALLYLLLDLEILLTYPLALSGYTNNIYGLIITEGFVGIITLGFFFELGKSALKIDSRQVLTNNKFKSYFTTDFLGHSNSYKSSLLKSSPLQSIFFDKDLLKVFFRVGTLKELLKKTSPLFPSKVQHYLFIITICLYFLKSNILPLMFNFFAVYLTSNILFIKYMVFYIGFLLSSVVFSLFNILKFPVSGIAEDPEESQDLSKKDGSTYLKGNDSSENVPEGSSSKNSREESSYDSGGEGSSKNASGNDSTYKPVITYADYEPASDSEKDNKLLSQDDVKKKEVKFADDREDIDRLIYSNQASFKTTLDVLTNQVFEEVSEKIDQSVSEHRKANVPASKKQIIDLEKKKEMCDNKLAENYTMGPKEEVYEGKGKGKAK